jgi:coenzyme F420-reducing hydrogenase alpha subunit
MAVEARTITLDCLARVEGEGTLYVRFRDGTLEDVRLVIFEPPRFFEALLRGRHCHEVPDITARICGICPVAYQMSAVHAIENAAGISLGGAIRELRRLLYCGEWIESHVLHIYMLHAPDFLGLPDAVQLARTHGDVVRRGLRMKKAGNALIECIGGRAIHPVNARVGGFWKAPSRADLLAMRPELEWARDAALQTVRWVATLPAPDVEYDYEFVSLRHPDEYPLNEGRIVSSAGLDIAATEWPEHFEEFQVRHSTALHARIKARGSYLTGPLARYSLNFDRLPPSVQAAAAAAGLGPVCRNPFKSIVVRALEVLFAFEEALRIIAAYQEPSPSFVAVAPRVAAAAAPPVAAAAAPPVAAAAEPPVAIGHAATEAPRGLLYQSYAVDAEGLVASAHIVPPTSQNQATIERDLWRVAQAGVALADAALQARCEQAVRNHDPCISCATHFLDLTVERA